MNEKGLLIANFYRFVIINNTLDFAKSIKEILLSHKIKGTVLLAKEGINANLAGKSLELKKAINKIVNLDVCLENLDIKYANTLFIPFSYLKVKIKKEIITFKQKNIHPSQKTGVIVNANEWNKLILDEQVLVIDTRNKYEVSMGTFKNSINPDTNNFSEFADFVEKNLNPYKHKKIAMFCTGGIRCEKASSFMLSKGFKEVFQLDGGILKYLEKIPKNESLWQGDCFVFDKRNS